MIAFSGLPKRFWVEAVNTACYTQNRSIMNKVHGIRRYGPWKGKKPIMSYFPIFGSKCFIHNNGKTYLKAFDERGDKGIFMGYSAVSEAFRVLNKRTIVVEESIHVRLLCFVIDLRAFFVDLETASSIYALRLCFVDLRTPAPLRRSTHSGSASSSTDYSVRSRVDIDLPTIEVRFEHLNGFLNSIHILPNRKKPLSILHEVSGIIKPGRMTLLLGPSSSGKTTLLLALAGKLGSDLKAHIKKQMRILRMK
nr:Retrovirus-related Pol polyprotein from transposon TNT 1-94 [Ipomoea batatas]